MKYETQAISPKSHETDTVNEREEEKHQFRNLAVQAACLRQVGAHLLPWIQTLPAILWLVTHNGVKRLLSVIEPVSF